MPWFVSFSLFSMIASEPCFSLIVLNSLLSARRVAVHMCVFSMWLYFVFIIETDVFVLGTTEVCGASLLIVSRPWLRLFITLIAVHFLL